LFSSNTDISISEKKFVRANYCFAKVSVRIFFSMTNDPDYIYPEKSLFLFQTWTSWKDGKSSDKNLMDSFEFSYKQIDSNVRRTWRKKRKYLFEKLRLLDCLEWIFGSLFSWDHWTLFCCQVFFCSLVL